MRKQNSKAPVGSSALLGVLLSSTIILVLHVISGVLLSDDAPQRSRPIKDSLLAEKLRHGLQLRKPLILGCLFGCLMLCECAADPVATASQQYSKKSDSARLQTAAAGVAERDAGKSAQYASNICHPFKTLEMMRAHKPISVIIMIIGVFSVLYTIGESVVTWLVLRALKPNAAGEPQPRKPRT